MNCRIPLLVLSLHAPLVSGQELQLFESLEGAGDFPALPQQTDTSASAGGTPPFRLRSLSRFADRYEAVLLDRSGQPLRVKWRQGEAATLVGGYQVQAGTPGSVVVQHPANDACQAERDSGVTCDTSALGRLTLVTALPLAVNTAAATNQQTQGPLSASTSQAPAAPTNPFEARVFSTRELSPEQLRDLRAARRAQGNDLRLRRDDDEGDDANTEPFQPRGMRTVQPAFGGRRGR